MTWAKREFTNLFKQAANSHLVFSQKASLEDITSESPNHASDTTSLHVFPTTDGSPLTTDSSPIHTKLSSSTGSLDRKMGKLKDMLSCTKSRTTTNAESELQLAPMRRASPAHSPQKHAGTPHHQRTHESPCHNTHSETSSVDLDVDVFSSVDDLTDDRGIEFVASRDKKGKSPVHQTITWINKRIPHSPARRSEKCRSGDNHVLTPPVLLNGVPTSNYQYLTPTICTNSKEPKTSTLNRLIGRPPDSGFRKRPKESPLKAMYESTVRANLQHTADASSR